jgi:hypothetical protein
MVAVALLPSELPAYRALIADFEADTGARVQVVAQQYAEIRRALAAEAAGGRGALDLVELDVYSLAAAAPFMAPLAPDAFAPALAALEPAALAAGEIDGLRFLPHRVSWQALLYDRTRVPQPLQTWDELLAVARAHSGKIGLKAARYEGLTCDVLPFVWAAGGSGDDLREPAALAAFRFLAQLAPHLHPQSATFKEPTIAEAMARGELVLHLNWPFAMRLYADQTLAPDRIGAAPLPRGPAGRERAGGTSVPANATRPRACCATAGRSRCREMAGRATRLVLGAARVPRRRRCGARPRVAATRGRGPGADYLALSRARQRVRASPSRARSRRPLGAASPGSRARGELVRPWAWLAALPSRGSRCSWSSRALCAEARSPTPTGRFRGLKPQPGRGPAVLARWRNLAIPAATVALSSLRAWGLALVARIPAGARPWGSPALPGSSSHHRTTSWCRAATPTPARRIGAGPSFASGHWAASSVIAVDAWHYAGGVPGAARRAGRHPDGSRPPPDGPRLAPWSTSPWRRRHRRCGGAPPARPGRAAHLRHPLVLTGVMAYRCSTATTSGRTRRRRCRRGCRPWRSVRGAAAPLLRRHAVSA